MSELKFLDLKIKNGITYKNEHFDLADQGIVAIQGPNGVGKSTIFNIMSTVLYGSSPDKHKKDDFARNEKPSEWVLRMRRGDDLYEVKYERKKAKGKKLKWIYTLLENGVDITDHNQLNVPKQINEIIGFSRKEYNGSVHLTQDSQHLMVRGLPSERKKYISDFFNIDDRYDVVYDAAKAEKKKVKDEIERISAYDHSRKMLESEINDIKLKDTEEIKTSIRYYSNFLHDQKTGKTSKEKLLDQWGLYDQHSELANSVVNPEEELDQCKKSEASLMSQVDQQSLIADYNKRALANNNRFEELNSKFLRLKEGVNSEDLDGMRSRKSELEYLRNNYNSLYHYKEEYENLPVKEQPNENLDEIDFSIREAELSKSKLRSKLDAIKDGKCPTCGVEHEASSIQKEEKELSEVESNLSSLKIRREELQTEWSSYRRSADLAKMLESYKVYTVEDQKELELLSVNIPKLEEYFSIQSQLMEMEYQELKPERDTSDLHLELGEIKKRKKVLEEVIKSKSLCPDKPAESKELILDSIETCNLEIEKLEQQIKSLESDLAKEEEKSYRKSRLQKQLDETEKELSKLENLKKEEYKWAKMVDAYGPKGLRLIQLKKIMDLLIQRLPAYTGLLFMGQKVSFNYKCDSGNVSIMVKREDDEGEYEYDVSMLSSGERKKLSVALILALSDCVPANKKANVLVLDEIDSPLDADGKYLFVNDLLPELKKDYSSIFVISHSERVVQSDVYDQVWTLSMPQGNNWTAVDRQSLH